MRCIEIYNEMLELVEEVMINYNMRCIEIGVEEEVLVNGVG